MGYSNTEIHMMGGAVLHSPWTPDRVQEVIAEARRLDEMFAKIESCRVPTGDFHYVNPREVEYVRRDPYA